MAFWSEGFTWKAIASRYKVLWQGLLCHNLRVYLTYNAVYYFLQYFDGFIVLLVFFLKLVCNRWGCPTIKILLGKRGKPLFLLWVQLLRAAYQDYYPICNRLDAIKYKSERFINVSTVCLQFQYIVMCDLVVMDTDCFSDYMHPKLVSWVYCSS